ncbi:sensor histidine kinase, partial [Algoriphagus sp.]|uniref:tetratricopeptide repeat-containing sensor histidine kinase n=1 Tax=Algoriphagus sp. TaxID=1872435 RepID=UPI0025CCA942
LVYHRIANALGDPHQIAVAEHYLGLVNRLQGNYSTALTYFESALEQFQSNVETQSSCLGPLFNIGVIHQIVGDYDKALKYFYQELDLRKELGIVQGSGNTLNSIGITLKKMGDYTRALSVYEEALQQSIAAGDSIDLSNIYNNMGTVKEQLGNNEGAFIDYQLSLALDRKDDYQSGIASSYESISTIYLKYGELDSAMAYALKAYEIRKNLGELKELIQSGHHLVTISLEAGNINDAWMYAEITTPKCEELGVAEVLMNNYKLLAEIYHKKGEIDLEAQALRAQLFWKDSLFDQRAIETARNLQVQYETKEKEQMMSSLQKENELGVLLISRQRKWQSLLILALGLVFFLLILAVRFYQLKIEAHQLKAAQEKILKEKKVKELESNNRILQMNAMLEGQEAERIRIAKDLHDGLGALLSTVKLHFQSVQKEIEALSKLNIYQKANNLLDNACTEVRRIAHNMMPDALSKLGLVQALEDLLEGLRLKGQKVSLEVINFENQEIPKEVELMIYRIIQELINNITKHAEAGSIIVQLSIHENELFISVEDDGCGFDVQETSDGIGLKNIKSRVAYLGGSLEMESIKNVGTTMNVTIPLPTTPTQKSDSLSDPVHL